jgi:hypothetical protein
LQYYRLGSDYVQVMKENKKKKQKEKKQTNKTYRVQIAIV